MLNSWVSTPIDKDLIDRQQQGIFDLCSWFYFQFLIIKLFQNSLSNFIFLWFYDYIDINVF